MTKARTYRFTAHTEARSQAVADAHGGLSMQAAVTMLVAKGLAAVEREDELSARTVADERADMAAKAKGNAA